jgi:uncharacterized protein YukE
MRTAKTLLIAAAALAATVTASQAQTVYSQNVVGYINITVTNGTAAMGANQLDTGSNTLNNVFQTGAISQKTLLQEWNGAGYNTYTYFNCADSPLGNSGWYNGSGVEVGLTNLVPIGYGFFIHNSAASTITLPTVGQVVQGTNVYTVPPGAAIYSIPEALAGLPLDNTNINFPAISQKTLYQAWNGQGFNTYTYFNCADSPLGASGWYNSSGVDEDTNAAIWPVAGGSFFIHNSSAVTINWTNVFEVQ